VLLETYRSNKRVTSSLDDEPDREFVADEISSLGQIEIDETERVVRKILGEMPERERRLLQAVLLEERDKDEVCAELGLSREYLRVLVHRAKQSFKSFYLKRLGEVRS
jgi:RNA polymerase sigma-70 factor (ECF subfamily)